MFETVSPSGGPLIYNSILNNGLTWFLLPILSHNFLNLAVSFLVSSAILTFFTFHLSLLTV